MKKIIYFASIFILLMGCKPKHEATSVFDFEVIVSRIESHKVWLDIFPQDEFLRYNLEWMPRDQWTYSSDSQYKEELAGLLTQYTDEQYKLVTEEGAFLSAIQVSPQTEYYIVITTLDSNRKPIDLRKVTFKSAEEHMTPFTMVADSIRMMGGLIEINPSDTVNTYFWNYELKSTIDRDWNRCHSAWFIYDVMYYYQMDFFPDMFSKGYSAEDAFVFYPEAEIAVGDTISLLMVGYDETGETSPAYMPFWIIWGGKDSASTVVEADKDGLESVFRDVFTSPARNTARVATWSPSWLPKSFADRKCRYIPQHIRSAKR